MPIRCIVHFAQAHPEFRLPELEAISELYGVTFSRPLTTPPSSSRKPCKDSESCTVGSTSEGPQRGKEEEYEWDPKRPFWVVDFDSEDHIRLLCERCILVKCVYFTFRFSPPPNLSCRAVYEHYGSSSSYDTLHAEVRQNSHLYERFQGNTSFRFTVHGYNHSIPNKRVKEIIDGFRYMDFRGPIDLKNPEVNLFVFEECKLVLKLMKRENI